jgi:retron-type reverse transcriptase
MDKSALYTTEDGTPQGGIISPVLANKYLHKNIFISYP